MGTVINSASQLDTLIQRATSESIPNGEIDLSLALEVSDVIRSRRVNPKECMRSLKKRIVATRSNPNTQLSAWRLTEVCVKNGGTAFIKEICTREFMDCMEHTILENDTNEDVEKFCTEMLQGLYVAFKNDSQLGYVAKVHDKLVARGVDFPPNGHTQSELVAAMFDSKTPADWIDSDACMICSTKFTLLNRKHHCRSCGGIYCQEHSSRRIPLPDLGIYEPVRVCDSCFDDYELKRHSGKKHKSKRKKKVKPTRDGDEDDDLRRAIEISLKETSAGGTAIPVVQPVKQEQRPTADEEDEDPDLKAAIEASLRDVRAQPLSTSFQHQRNPPIPIDQPKLPAFQALDDLTSAEENDIYLFASLVERMKSQPATAILEDDKLQQLYRKVLGVAPKLNSVLHDTVIKCNTLVDMNSKISDIMNVYDSLLERQLQSINLSQQYSVPQLPSDPFSFYGIQKQEASKAESFESAKLQTQITSPYPMESSSPTRIPADVVNSISSWSQEPSERREYINTVPIRNPQSNSVTPMRETSNQMSLSQLGFQSAPLNNTAAMHLKESEPPYPLEEEEHIIDPRAAAPVLTSASQLQPTRQSEDKITDVNFPTVPVTKPPVEELIPEEVNEVEEDEPEHLLIEL
ncbi:LAMI_0C01992g1_1 [Lachancea mirantina]|uniref:Vacuolar protein sorting-associated protein 27 n=1 Tax=Lachancea mirantina TaxID=1230905 RepID=A0A1G4J0R0_9SACH|nr:LAMI_0C01992g1_1 [Lachancea mirantina]